MVSPALKLSQRVQNTIKHRGEGQGMEFENGKAIVAMQVADTAD